MNLSIGQGVYFLMIEENHQDNLQQGDAGYLSPRQDSRFIAFEAHPVLADLDNSALSGFHFKALITSGMGFFTDAYDLFIIGVALAILKPLWHLNSLEISLLG